MQKRVVIFAGLCLLIVIAGLNLYATGFEAIFHGFARSFEAGYEVISLLDEDTPHRHKSFAVASSAGEELQSLAIVATMGDIRLVPTPGRELNVEGTLTVYGLTQEDVDGYFEQAQVELVMEATGHVLQVIGENPPRKISGIRMDVEVQVPEGLRVEVITGLGDVEAVGLTGPLSVDGSFGEIHVAAIGGNVAVKGSHSAIVVQDIAGDLDLQPRFKGLVVNNVQGDVHLNGSHVEVEVAGIGGTAQVEGRFINGQVTGLAGELEFNVEHSNLRFAELAQRVVGRGRHGRITIIDPWADLGLEGEFTTFDLRIGSTDFRLHGQTEYTQLHSDFPLEIEEERQQKVFQYVQGTGEHEYRIAARHGELQVVKNYP